MNESTARPTLPRFVTALLGLGGIALVAGCMHPLQPAPERVCSYEKARAVGVDHAVNGIQRLPHVSRVCHRDIRDDVERGYADGYLEGMEAALEKERASVCGYDQGYKQGVNDANAGREMRSDVAGICTDATRPDTERGYREGYTTAMASRPDEINVNINGGGGSGSSDATAPEPLPEPDCLSAFGKKACGYNCIEAFGTITCASHPDYQCIEAFGQVKCGIGCSEEFGEITCAEEDPAPVVE